MTGRSIDETLAVMAAEQANSLVGVPVQVAALAHYGVGRSLKSALLTTDHVPQAIVRSVENAWGCVVYNHYGMTEMGLGGGVECAARRGYHLREADLLFEVVDPTTGQPLPDGVEGEVVFTTLTRRGMPLIRYRTGDISRFLPDPCPCGTTLKTLARIVHRAAGYVTIGGGAPAPTLTMADLDEALFAIDGVLNFTATVTGGAREVLLVQVDAAPVAGGRVAQEAAAALDAIPAIQLARSQGRLDVTVTVQPTGYTMSGPAKKTIVDRR